MSAISLKSITGITSITTPAGVDNQLTLHTNDTTERLRIDSSGKVGLGTTGSDYALSIREADNNNKFLMLEKSSGQELLQIREDGSNHIIIDGSHASGELHFYTVGSERLRITSNGRVGIGTDDPKRSLHIIDNVGEGIGVNGSRSGIQFGLVSMAGASYNAILSRVGTDDDYVAGTEAGDLCLAPEKEGAFVLGLSPHLGAMNVGVHISRLRHFNIYYGGDFKINTGSPASPSEKLRIDSSGNFNLGLTASPVSSSTEQGVFLAGADSTQSVISSNVTPFVINRVGTGGNDRDCIEFRNNGVVRGIIGAIGASNGLYLNIGGSEKLRIASDGSVLVNKTSTSDKGKFEVKGFTADDIETSDISAKTIATFSGSTPGTTAAGKGAGIVIKPIADRGCNYFIGVANDSTNQEAHGRFIIRSGNFYNQTVERLRIASDGKVGIGTDASGSQLSIGRASGNGVLTLDAYGVNRSRLIFRNNVVRGTETNIDAIDDDLRFVVNSGERLRIYSNGCVTKPTNAMFKVVRTSSQSISSNGWHVIGYNSDSASGCFDIGNNFDTSNHRFTAPVTGYYQFGLNQRIDSGNGDYFRVAFTVNGATPSGQYPNGHAIYKDGDGFAYYSFSITSLIYLTAGQYVRAEAYSSSDTSWVLQDESQFYGYLVG